MDYLESWTNGKDCRKSGYDDASDYACRSDVTVGPVRAQHCDRFCGVGSRLGRDRLGQASRRIVGNYFGEGALLAPCVMDFHTCRNVGRFFLSFFLRATGVESKPIGLAQSSALLAR